MALSAQTYNFVVLMAFFMVVLWVVKVFVRIRKLLKLNNALTSNLVVRVDGNVQPNQHIDAISLGHLQQILNTNLMHTSTMLKEIRPSAHIEAKSIEISKSQSTNPNSDYSLTFVANCVEVSTCEVFVSPTRKVLRQFYESSRHPADPKKLRKVRSPKEMFSKSDYRLKRTCEIRPGEEVKVSISIPKACVVTTDEKSIGLVLRVAKADQKERRKGPETFELSIVNIGNVSKNPPPVRCDHQVIFNKGKLMRMQDIYGTENDDLCLICYTNPINTILLPCRHMCICRDCLLKMVAAKCPICRTPFKSHISFKSKTAVCDALGLCDGKEKTGVTIVNSVDEEMLDEKKRTA